MIACWKAPSLSPPASGLQLPAFLPSLAIDAPAASHECFVLSRLNSAHSMLTRFIALLTIFGTLLHSVVECRWHCHDDAVEGKAVCAMAKPHTHGPGTHHHHHHHRHSAGGSETSGTDQPTDDHEPVFEHRCVYVVSKPMPLPAGVELLIVPRQVVDFTPTAQRTLAAVARLDRSDPPGRPRQLRAQLQVWLV